MSKPYSDMNAHEFLDLVDAVMQGVEHQHQGDPVGMRALGELKDEIRRRVMAVEATPVTEKPITTMVKVEVRHGYIAEVVPFSRFGARFKGDPSLVTIVGTVEGEHRSGKYGFLSSGEAEAFLQGVRATAPFGFHFTEVDYPGDPTKENFIHS